MLFLPIVILFFQDFTFYLQNLGSTDSTGLYFQAALKFLHGASLLESSGTENSKHNERIQSMQIYSSTAKLCE